MKVVRGAPVQEGGFCRDSAEAKRGDPLGLARALLGQLPGLGEPRWLFVIGGVLGLVSSKPSTRSPAWALAGSVRLPGLGAVPRSDGLLVPSP